MIELPLIGLIAGVVLVLAVIAYFFLRRRDPLPERDPKCIWHTTVRKIDRIYDGDTFFAYVKGHNPIDRKPTGIRMRGIDTPELKDSRPAVKKKAEKAKAFVESKIQNAKKIHLYNVSTADKYGRILATVFCDRRDLAKMLLEEKLAKPYDGGTKSKW